MPSFRAVILALLASGLFAPLSAPPAGADAVAPVEARLPTALWNASAASDGRHLYVFGGSAPTGTSDGILRYDPATDVVQAMAARLPSPRFETSAVWTGRYVFLFGGWTGAGWSDEVVRYDPAVDEVRTMGARLPAPQSGTAVAWDGRHAYVFAGPEIYRYDPVGDALEAVGARLSSWRFGASAVSDGTFVYLIGGRGGCAAVQTYCDDVLRYDPAADALAPMGARLPSGRQVTAAAWDGRRAHLFGGYDETFVGEILRYDPASDVFEVSDQTLPLDSRVGSTAAWVGSRAYVVGGYATDRILAFSLPPRPPGPPLDLVAEASVGLPAIRLAWQAPLDDGGAPIDAYAVYRAAPHDPEPRLLATVPGTARAYEDAGCPALQECRYRVAARNLAGEGLPSGEAAARWPL